MSTMTFSSSRMAAAFTTVRIDFAILPCLPSDNGLTWNIENETIDNNEEHHFKAKVIEVGNGYIIVEPNEDEEERKSSDRFHIDNKNNVNYKEGQILAITYIGGINESYPAQIGVTNISIVESN